MKSKGDFSDFIQHRDNELKEAYRRQMKRGGASSTAEIYENMVREPAPRFWVGEEHAAEVVSRMRKGETPVVLASRRRMYAEIFRRVERMLADQPGIPLIEAVVRVVNSPAPEFYMSAETARRQLRLILRRSREEGRRRQ